MTQQRDGTWESVGSKLRDDLRDEYEFCGEGCVYVDMVSFRDYRPADWNDHSAVHALYVLTHGGYNGLPEWPNRPTDSPALREDIRSAFSEHTEAFDKSFEDERDEWADRKAIVALRGINTYLEAQISI